MTVSFYSVIYYRRRWLFPFTVLYYRRRWLFPFTVLYYRRRWLFPFTMLYTERKGSYLSPRLKKKRLNTPIWNVSHTSDRKFGWIYSTFYGRLRTYLGYWLLLKIKLRGELSISKCNLWRNPWLLVKLDCVPTFLIKA